MSNGLDPVYPEEQPVPATADEAYDVFEGAIDDTAAHIGTSVVRTFIPAVVGAVVSVILGYLASQGFSADAATVTVYLIPVVTAAYYAGIRYLEVNVNPAFGKLLGKASAPVYTH